MAPSVINLRHGEYDVYIGRQKDSEFHFGNIASHLKSDIAPIKVETREEAVAAFADWLIGVRYQEVQPKRRQWILDNLHTLRGKRLGCFCAPLLCHGEILIGLLKKMSTTLGIIGTAGRKEDAKLLTPEIYKSMKKAALKVFRDTKSSALVSGGAAWADHIAVRMFIHGLSEKLTLHLPCEFVNGKFLDTGKVDYKTNPGGTSNHYHRKFSEACGEDSLADIQLAIDKGAIVKHGGGFFDRNTQVAADADFLLAMTFGNGAQVKDGGTADTVKKYLDFKKTKSFHYDLNALKLFENATLCQKT